MFQILSSASVPAAVNVIAVNARERDSDIDRMTDMQSKSIALLDNFIKSTKEKSSFLAEREVTK